MGKPRCKGTDCTKFAHQKKLVNEHQKGLGIDLLTLCTPCAKDHYPDYVGLVCSHANCTTVPQGGALLDYKIKIVCCLSLLLRVFNMSYQVIFNMSISVMADFYFSEYSIAI